MRPLRFAVIGAGFWARYQLAAWREVAGAHCVALCDRTRSKAEDLGRDFGISAIYESAEEMIAREKPDFLDIITGVDTHSRFVHFAAQHRIPVICQKPMAPTMAEAEEMIAVCAASGTPFSVHENWRWQNPIRELKKILDSAVVGRVFRARIDYCNSFPVFEKQPFLKTLKQFILSDMGSHILDVARFLFGEAACVYCQTQRIRSDISGEDVATVIMQMQSGATVVVYLSYASRVEQDRFPETFVHIEGAQGALELAPDYWLRVTTEQGTHARRCPPPLYLWADPRYSLVHSSIVACHQDIFNALQKGMPPETSAADNLKTLKLAQAAYDSESSKRVIQLL